MALREPNPICGDSTMFFLGPFHIYRDEIEIQESQGNITKTLLDLVSALNLAFFYYSASERRPRKRSGCSVESPDAAAA